MLAATRTPLTASGSAPGKTLLIARMAARSGRKSAALRPSAALVTSSSTVLSPGISVATKRPSPTSGGGTMHASARAGLFRRHLVRGLDAVLGVADRGRQIVEREGVRMDLGGVEALLAHEGFGAVGRALAFAADAVDVDVVAHDLGDIDRRRLVREGGEADLAAAVDHAHRLVDGVGCARALEHVVDALAAVKPAHGRDRVLPPDVDHV